MFTCAGHALRLMRTHGCAVSCSLSPISSLLHTLHLFHLILPSWLSLLLQLLHTLLRVRSLIGVSRKLGVRRLAQKVWCTLPNWMSPKLSATLLECVTILFIRCTITSLVTKPYLLSPSSHSSSIASCCSLLFLIHYVLFSPLPLQLYLFTTSYHREVTTSYHHHHITIYNTSYTSIPSISSCSSNICMHNPLLILVIALYYCIH